jgi:two-component system cell cycle response regulator DivK
MKKIVLVAEDYADVRRMTKLMLESCGYNVIEAEDGLEAFEQAKAHHPDVILMDIAMPLINGITAARLIRSNEKSKDIPIVAVTAYGNEYRVGEDFGFDEVISKPIDVHDLRELVGRYTSELAE